MGVKTPMQGQNKIQRIVVRAEILRQRLSSNRLLEHPTQRQSIRSVIHAENPTHDVLVDVGSEGQSDLLRNSRTAPGRIPPLHLNDGVDELLTGSFWTGLTSVLWGKQQPVLDEDVMEMQQSGRLHNVLGRMRA